MNKYRIRIVFVGKAMERTLPYELHSMELAEQTADALNTLLEEHGYHHFAAPYDQLIPVTPNQGKLKKKGAV